MLSKDGLRDCRIDSSCPSSQTILRCLGSTPALSRASKARSSASIDCSPSEASIHSRKSVEEESSSNGMFRAPLAHRMRIAPLLTAVTKLTIDVIVDHRRFNTATVIAGVTTTFIRNSNEPTRCHCGCTGGTRSAAPPGVLPHANLALVRHRRGRFTVRAGLLGVTSLGMIASSFVRTGRSRP